MNPEIWEKLTHYGKKQDLRLSAIKNMIVKVGAIFAQSTQKLMEFRGQGTKGGRLDTGTLLTAQIDVIALLGHTNYELSLRRREAIKPNLNKKYGSLCSSQTPVTTLLFGDKPQSQLTAIRASNRISHTAVHNSSKSSTETSISPETEPAFFRQGPLSVQVETTEKLEEKVGNQQKINTADDIMSKLHMLQVTQFEDFMPKLIAYLVTQTSCFKSGRLAICTHWWQKIISYTEILQMVSWEIH